ncbi:hypothetical protein TrLO_g10721 [Triparma laevis f. longispina]|uniref:Phosphatidic acid phosphatase type 2/haloperoxidase domain-containing protein n=1 Tax=Triparma laevis f. longispina TaxID=1714387 RepID=A0A9W7F5Z1_9STRA|nr:hypothetical protein TrLO_g10721 [Triparma laevis f. longispina]
MVKHAAAEVHLGPWSRLIEWDLTQIHKLQRFMYDPSNDWIRDEVDKVVSSSPLNDINITSWITFFTIMALNAYTDRWYTFLWCTTLNIAFTMIARVLIQARRPFEIDKRLRPVTNKTRQSYGFPSVESHMAVVVNGFVAARFAEWWVSIPLFALTLFVGFTRVYSCARFVHQILLSYISGTVGLMVFLQFEDYARKFSINWQLHWVYLVLCIFVGIALLGLAVEDNSSSLGGIPREEYIRVVGGILNTEPGKIHEHMHAQASKKLDGGAGGGSDRQRQRYAEKLYARKDSFFYLQNSIAKKEMEKKQIKQQYQGYQAARQRGGSKMTEQERWQEELKSDPNNAFLQNLIAKNYGASN